MIYKNNILVLTNYSTNPYNPPSFHNKLNQIFSKNDYKIILEIFFEDEHTNKMIEIHTKTLFDLFFNNKNNKNTLNNLLLEHFDLGGFEFNIKIYFN
jgi:hypothetical protein